MYETGRSLGVGLGSAVPVIVLISEDLMAEGSENGSGVGQESEGRPPFSTRQVCKLWSTSFFFVFQLEINQLRQDKSPCSASRQCQSIGQGAKLNTMQELRIHVKLEAC